MYLKFSCFSENDTYGTEICSFYGMRYIKVGFAVLSTEHERHDYLLPMNEADYESFLASLEAEIVSGTKMAEITGDEVYRVTKGSFPLLRRASSYSYLIRSLRE